MENTSRLHDTLMEVYGQHDEWLDKRRSAPVRQDQFDGMDTLHSDDGIGIKYAETIFPLAAQ